MLELATLNNFTQHSKPLPAPVIINKEPEYKISKIVDSKIDCQRAYKLLYKAMLIIFLSLVLFIYSDLQVLQYKITKKLLLN